MADQLRVTAELIIVFVFAYAKRWFSHNEAQLVYLIIFGLILFSDMFIARYCVYPRYN